MTRSWWIIENLNGASPLTLGTNLLAVGPLFSASGDAVNFNGLNLNTFIGPFTNALGGGDTVTLPNAGDPNAALFGAGVTFSGGGGDDTIIGGNSDDTVTGSTGTDTLTGNAGDDNFIIEGSDSDGAPIVVQVTVDGPTQQVVNGNATFGTADHITDFSLADDVLTVVTDNAILQRPEGAHNQDNAGSSRLAIIEDNDGNGIVSGGDEVLVIIDNLTISTPLAAANLVTVPPPCVPLAPSAASASAPLPDAQPLQLGLDDGSGEIDLTGAPCAPCAPAAPPEPTTNPPAEPNPPAQDLSVVDPTDTGGGPEDDGTVIVA